MASSLHYYRPMTPPASATAVQFAGNLHRRTVSGSSSVYTTDESSPDSAVTNLTTPGRSPAYRQHGPALLPKIRLQDVVVEPISHSGPHRHRRVLSSTANPPGFFPYPTTRPAVQRPVLSPVDCSVISPISASPLTAGSHFSSTLTSPVVFTPSHAFPPSRRRSGGHSRSQTIQQLGVCAATSAKLRERLQPFADSGYGNILRLPNIPSCCERPCLLRSCISTIRADIARRSCRARGPPVHLLGDHGKSFGSRTSPVRRSRSFNDDSSPLSDRPNPSHPPG
jgi:hypothetical protein